MKRLCYIFIFLIAFSNKIYSQTSYYYPIQIAQYPSYLNFINPAISCLEGDIEFYATSKNYINYYSNFSSYFGGLNIILTDKQNRNNYSTGGFKINAENEGKYISRTKMYVMYSYTVKLKNDFNIAGGIDLGVANFSIKSTPSIGGKSEFAADANAGFYFYNKKLELSLSVNQIFNGKFQPYQEISILKRHYNFYFANKFFINKSIILKPQVLVRFPSYISYNLDYTLEAYWKIFILGLSLRHKHGGAIWVGLKNQKLGDGNLNFTFCYNAPLQKSLININSIEFAIKYNFIKKQ